MVTDYRQHHQTLLPLGEINLRSFCTISSVWTQIILLAAGIVFKSNTNRIKPSFKPRISCGCSAGVEQSATTDQGRLLATDISAGDQVSSLPSVIWLMEVWRCLC